MKIFYLPDLGEGLAEAEVREWYVKEGDVVKVDQPLVSMETAKAVVDVPSPYAGKVVTLHGKANEIIKTGAPFISFEIEGETAASEGDKGSVVGKLESSAKKWDDSEVIIGSAKTRAPALKAMPAARVLASQLNVNLSEVKPTGPQGLITPADVKNHIEQQGAAPSMSSTSSQYSGKSEVLHGVRRMMAQAMMQSHRDIVPVTIIEDVDISHLPAKIDMTVLLLKAMVAGAKEEPAMNAWFDGKSLELKKFEDVNIGLAVDTLEGLFVPVIKKAQALSDSEMREKIDNYKISVKDRSIPPADMQGATITLSNFGTIAGRYATPIIVPPAVAILGVGRSREAVTVMNGEMKPGKVLPLSLTFDHRAATGGEATRYLAAVIKYLQKAG
jgi:pyruvate dehydrogenase E2 component (dihydrolipoamide acetyltransferase)